jgi:hypothetical protein
VDEILGQKLLHGTAQTDTAAAASAAAAEANNKAPAIAAGPAAASSSISKAGDARDGAAGSSVDDADAALLHAVRDMLLASSGLGARRPLHSAAAGLGRLGAAGRGSSSSRPHVVSSQDRRRWREFGHLPGLSSGAQRQQQQQAAACALPQVSGLLAAYVRPAAASMELPPAVLQGAPARGEEAHQPGSKEDPSPSSSVGGAVGRSAGQAAGEDGAAEQQRQHEVPADLQLVLSTKQQQPQQQQQQRRQPAGPTVQADAAALQAAAFAAGAAQEDAANDADGTAAAAGASGAAAAGTVPQPDAVASSPVVELLAVATQTLRSEGR